MFQEAMWITVPEEHIRDFGFTTTDLNGRFAYFRCDFSLAEAATMTLDITACSRYRLWVNGQPVHSGPCRGDVYRQYYDTINISKHLLIGDNTLAVQVLLCDTNAVESMFLPQSSLTAIMGRATRHRLAIEGNAVNARGEVLATVTTGVAKWKVKLEDTTVLTSVSSTENLGAVQESFDFRNTCAHWKTASTEAWPDVELLRAAGQKHWFENFGVQPHYPLRPRQIPLLKETVTAFPAAKNPQLTPMGIRIPANSTQTIRLERDAHTNAHPQFPFSGGKGAQVTISYAEIENPGDYYRIEDKLVLDGSDLTYEPFWYRTFRYITITVQASAEDVVLYPPVVIETGYPLDVQAVIRSSDPKVEALWDICVRTLRNCMYETYMDCPFYEQLQYIMDTRLQVLFTYCVSNDLKLVKKALEDFHHSLRPDGLIQGRYPSAYTQIISTFSLHYIIMLEEYLRQTGDIATVKRYRSDVDSILEYYDRHIGEMDLVEHLGYWQFVDWQKAWETSGGVPTAALTGPSTIINLMYGYALLRGADLNEVTGRPGVAQEYRVRQQKIAERIQALCWDENRRLYREGPATQQFSQHAQAWAILNGMVSKETAANMLSHTLEDEDMIMASFAASYEVFRAFEWAGIYEKTETMMQRWHDLVDAGCTTCPETPEDARSQCHAWSALPIFEYVRTIAGIRAAQSNWETVEIKPNLMGLPDLNGTVPTPKGNISFRYTGNTYEISLPDGMEAVFISPDGSCHSLSAGTNRIG